MLSCECCLSYVQSFLVDFKKACTTVATIHYQYACTHHLYLQIITHLLIGSTVLPIFFYIGQPLGAQFINNTPRIVGNSVEAEFITTGPVTSVICSLGSGVRQDCK